MKPPSLMSCAGAGQAEVTSQCRIDRLIVNPRSAIGVTIRHFARPGLVTYMFDWHGWGWRGRLLRFGGDERRRGSALGLLDCGDLLLKILHHLLQLLELRLELRQIGGRRLSHVDLCAA